MGPCDDPTEAEIPGPTYSVKATACDGQVTVSWQDQEHASWYDIYWSNFPGVTRANSNRIRSGPSPYVHTSITNGQAYYYRVNGGGSTWETGLSYDEASATPRAGVACPFTVGGTVSGLSGSVVLKNDGGGILLVTSNGPFVFPNPVDDGSTYNVTVLTHPEGQTCHVTNGTGTITGANVDDVKVTCVPVGVSVYTVGGVVVGITGGTLTLQNNGGDDLDITADGSFTFATPLADGSDYNVTVLRPPAGQICHIRSGTGTIAGADVTSVGVLCRPGEYTVGGEVSGMTGGTLTLQNNGGDDLDITADGPFTFWTPLADGSGYAVTVFKNPAGQTCSVANGSGTISGANVTDVSVTCIPSSVSPVAVVAAGEWHTLAIKTDGTLWAWGENANGQVGDGTTVRKYRPTQIGVDSDWSFVAAGAHHSVAVKTDGTLWTWGWNSAGQLGDGTTTDRWSPTQIGVTGWSTALGDIAAGFSHTVALGGDGRLYAWGSNATGQLGDGTNVNRLSPTQIGIDSDWASVAAGEYHTVALKMGSTLWAWGRNDEGQLGDGSNVNKLSPTRIGSDTDWNPPAAGARHTVAVKKGGTIWAWGKNDSGQLGDGTATDRWNPTQIGSGSDWIASVAAGGAHTIALRATAGFTLWTWGWNLYGQLGDGTSTSRSSPAQIGSETDWRYVAAGYNYALAIKADGTLWAWGRNQRGQLGDGTNVNKSIPTQIR